MKRRAALALLVLFGVACRPAGEGASGVAADPLAEPRALVEQGRYDEALAVLGDAADAEALFLVGRAWAGKARTAPLPAPAPGGSTAGLLLKDEERRALDAFERAVAMRPDHAGAHLAIAALLTPYALERAAAERAALARARRSRRPPEPPPRVASGPDAGVERVLREYGSAVQGDPASLEAVESLIRFARSAGRLQEASAAFQELVRRDRENPDVLVRYGDFLAGEKGDPDAALAQYAQALIWRPDDGATKLKMADIYLDLAAAHIARQEWASAQARLLQARRYAADPRSRQAGRLSEQEAYLQQIRGAQPGR